MDSLFNSRSFLHTSNAKTSLGVSNLLMAFSFSFFFFYDACFDQSYDIPAARDVATLTINLGNESPGHGKPNRNSFLHVTNMVDFIMLICR